MAKFVYRMQSILNIKEKMESQARNDFARARRHLNEEEEKLQNLMDRKAFYEQQGRELQKSGLNVRDILENRGAIERMQEFITLQKKAVVTAQAQLEDARQKLQDAVQEKRTQERLKEKAFEEFVREENAKESKEIDELVSYTYGQKEQI